jgi:hypothetical protein
MSQRPHERRLIEACHNATYELEHWVPLAEDAAQDVEAALHKLGDELLDVEDVLAGAGVALDVDGLREKLGGVAANLRQAIQDAFQDGWEALAEVESAVQDALDQAAEDETVTAE